MQNQPFSRFQNEDVAAPEGGQNSQRRLLFLQGLLGLILFVIGVRVCVLQVFLRDRFVAIWSKSTELEETLSPRSGRILSRDGAIFAYDETRYDLAVDYRWIENPPDARWLQREVLRRLDARERTDTGRRAEIEDTILREREELLRQLSLLTSVSIEQLVSQAQSIQTRVEKMVTAVEERRRSKNEEFYEVRQLSWEDGFSGMLETIRRELTTPPRRYADDPIILKEELQPHVLVEGVPLDVVAAVQSRPHEFRGVHVQTRSMRVYPLEDVAPHAIGLRRPPRQNDDSVAEGGIEQAYDSQLRGKAGRRISILNRRGDVIETKIADEPIDGVDLVLTLDSQLQASAERLLDDVVLRLGKPPGPKPAASGAVAIVMDLWTGDLLSMAVSPRVSLQQQLNPSTEEWQRMLAIENQPFFPRATRMALPPGAIFTVVTSIAALEEGLVNDASIFHCQGYLQRPDQFRCQQFRLTGTGHGDLRIDDALCQSCNVFFFDLGQRLELRQLADWASAFGLGQKTGVDLPAELTGQITSRSLESYSTAEQQREAMQLAIGQGELLVTPLQVARLMAAIGNGGYLVTPHLVHQQGEQTSKDSRLQKIPGIESATLETVRRGMEMVVQHPLGTGVSAMTSGMTIAAKTGTAQSAGRADHAWMAGFVPAEAPRFSFVVVLEQGGAGARLPLRSFVTF